MSAVRIESIPTPILLSPQRAEDFLGIGRTKLIALAKARKIESVRSGRHRYFTHASLLKYVAGMERDLAA